jgi:hypothetical protein
MAFYSADYDTFVFLGDPTCLPLWFWKVWHPFCPALDPLIQAARGKPAIRSTQLLPKKAGVVRFGRLGWKDSDHQKWAHDSPANKGVSASWVFLTLQIWAPAWTACERENRAPDVFLSIRNESFGRGHGQVSLFNPLIILAIVSELAGRSPSEVNRVVRALQEFTSANLVGYQRRPWGRPFGSVGFSNSIQDLTTTGLFKPGSHHKGKIGFHLFAEKWEPPSPEDTGL